MSESFPIKSAYRSEIDGLRAFAVLAVVGFHAFPIWLKGGFIGVDVFFVISGFLISSHIFDKLDRGRFSLKDFYGRRIRRIFPALILVSVSSLIFGWFVLLADEYRQLGKHIASGAAFVSNFIFASEVGYFQRASESKPLLHLWSLSVEEQFYLFFPLLLLFASKLRLNLLCICLLVLVCSFSVNLMFVSRFPIETFFWPFGRFWELLIGSVLAWFTLYKGSNFSNYYRRFSDRSHKNVLIQTLNKVGFPTLTGLSLLIISALFIDKAKPFPSYVATLPVLGAALIIIGGSNSYTAKLFLCNRLAVWFGLISYPLYLWHWPILSYLHIIEDDTPSRNLRIFGVTLSVVLAWVTYRFIERPIRFRKAKKSSKTIALIAGILFVGLIGFWTSTLDLREIKNVDTVHLRKGMEHRIGASSRWYKGKNDWLFLGNFSNNTVAKLKLSVKPTAQNVADEVDHFNELADLGSSIGARVALLVGPNKSSVYGEHLPIEINPSSTRYISYFTEPLSQINNFYMLDPTDILIREKDIEGSIYWKTDTHWNQKGAYLAFAAIMDTLDLKYPEIQFRLEGVRKGDLIEISNLTDFVLPTNDNWIQNSLTDEGLEIAPNLRQQNPDDMYATDWEGVVKNAEGLNDLSVWVLSDSFAHAIKPYLNASFSTVRYLGHWGSNKDVLPTIISEASEKPDLLFMVRVERSF